MTDLGVRQRPRDRKAQIVATAAELFRMQGYRGTSMTEIATAVGITAPALYRHYPGKRAILADAVASGVDALIATVQAGLSGAGLPSGGSPTARLAVLLGALAELAVARRDASVLWQREGQHLDPAVLRPGREELNRAVRQWAAVLREVRPELSEADADLLCWSALSVYGSISTYHVSPAEVELDRLLPKLAGAVLRCTAVPGELPGAPAGSAGPASGGGPASGAGPADRAAAHPPELPARRELLLRAAARLFRERGYHAVSMVDIGNAVGIAGPSVYRHFASKADLLIAAADRVAERLAEAARPALDPRLPAASALAMLVRGYVEVAVEHRDLIAVYLSEGRQLPADKGVDLRRFQREYLANWTRLVLAERGGGSAPEARIAVHAAVAVVVDTVRTARFSRRPGLAAELTGLASAILRG